MCCIFLGYKGSSRVLKSFMFFVRWSIIFTIPMKILSTILPFCSPVLLIFCKNTIIWITLEIAFYFYCREESLFQFFHISNNKFQFGHYPSVRRHTNFTLSLKLLVLSKTIFRCHMSSQTRTGICIQRKSLTSYENIKYCNLWCVVIKENIDN